MQFPSTKPYLIRSIYEWCNECGFTPLLSVKVADDIGLPAEKIKNGEIIFNIHDSAVRDLIIGNDTIRFSARFNGAAREIVFPTDAVKGIFAKEVNQGIAFSEIDLDGESIPEKSEDNVNNKLPKSEKIEKGRKGKANLRLIK